MNEFNQGLGAELMADHWKLSRTRLDEFSLASHEKAAAAIDDHLFADEIAPVTLPDGTVFDTDEGVRRGTTLEKMALDQTRVQTGRGNPCRQRLANQ